MSTSNELLTTQQAGEMIGRSSGAIRKAIERGKLKATKRGRDYDIEPRDLWEWRSNLSKGGRKPKNPQLTLLQ